MSAANNGNAETEAWRNEHGITVEGKNCPDPFTTFDQTEMFPKAVRKSFVAQGFERPTPIQGQCWPILLNGRDVIGIAKTGSGKTLAFIVPAIMHIRGLGDGAPASPICCVLAPTRELAQQIDLETQKVLPKAITSVVVYGGTSKGPQIEALKAGAQIVVATPGRLLDLAESGCTTLNHVSFFVLDEADRMLDLGFEPSVRAICAQIPSERHTVMFSATWPESVQALAAKFLSKPLRINVGSMELLANKDVTQNFIFVRHDGQKIAELRKIMQKYKGRRMLIFALFKKSVNYLETQLRDTGCIAIHSDKSQQHREAMLDRFRHTQGAILVATDVAARGLDVKELEVVINYEFPLSCDDYVHRIGRTGRAGAKGEAFTLLSETESYFDGFAARDLERVLKNVGQPVPSQIEKKAENFRFRAKPTKTKKEQIPDVVAFTADAPSKSMKFADSDDDDDQPPAKKQRI